MTRNITRLVAHSQMLRQAVAKWKTELPASDNIALSALNKIRQDTADDLMKKSEQWITENKLIHAGAAQKLAKELREKL
jgi:hypothetical protein